MQWYSCALSHPPLLLLFLAAGHIATPNITAKTTTTIAPSANTMPATVTRATGNLLRVRANWMMKKHTEPLKRMEANSDHII